MSGARKLDCYCRAQRAARVVRRLIFEARREAGSREQLLSRAVEIVCNAEERVPELVERRRQEVTQLLGKLRREIAAAAVGSEGDRLGVYSRAVSRRRR